MNTDKLLELFNERKRYLGTISTELPELILLGLSLDLANMHNFFFGEEVVKLMKTPRLMNSIYGEIQTVALSYSTDYSIDIFNQLIVELSETHSFKVIVFGADFSNENKFNDNVSFVKDVKNNFDKNWIQDFFLVLEDQNFNFIINNSYYDQDCFFGKALSSIPQENFINIESFFNIEMGNLICGDDFVLIGRNSLEDQVELWRSLPGFLKLIRPLAKQIAAEKKVDSDDLCDQTCVLLVIEKLFTHDKKWVVVENLKEFDPKDVKSIPSSLGPFDVIEFLKTDFPNFHSILNKYYFENNNLLEDFFEDTKIVSEETSKMNSQEHLSDKLSEMFSDISSEDPSIKNKNTNFNFFQYHLDWFLTYCGYDIYGNRIFYLGKPEYLGDEMYLNKELISFLSAYVIWKNAFKEKLKNERIFGEKIKIFEMPIAYETIRNRITKTFSYNNSLLEISFYGKRALIPKYEEAESLGNYNKKECIDEVLTKHGFQSELGVDFTDIVKNSDGSLHCSIKVLKRNINSLKVYKNEN